MFDTHVNFHNESFEEDLDDVIERARRIGVRNFIAICDRLDSFDQVYEITSNNDGVYCSVGVHPHHAKDYQELTKSDFTRYTKLPKVVAIGETGLDFHRNYSEKTDQIRCFKVQLEVAREANLPVIVHTRMADALTSKILEEEYKKARIKILLHCYTSGRSLLEVGLEMGAYVSVSGILSFPSARNVREVIRLVPIDRLLLETDAPYLAPVPKRGRRNEPSFLPFVAEALASLLEMDAETVKTITQQNANTFFGLSI